MIEVVLAVAFGAFILSGVLTLVLHDREETKRKLKDRRKSNEEER